MRSDRDGLRQSCENWRHTRANRLWNPKKCGQKSFNVDSIMREISRKPIRFIRKASTATSLAALKTRGAEFPCSSAF